MRTDRHTDPARLPLEATTALWHQFRSGLQRFLQARLPTPSDADDVLQEVFLRIHTGLEHLQDTTRVQAWIYGIARRAVADFYRARRPATPAIPDDATTAALLPEDPLADYDGDHDVHEEVLSWLLPTIETLPPRYAVPLRMADVEGRKQHEVAAALGLTVSGAKSRIQRGRALLREALLQCCVIEFGADGRAAAFQRRPPSPAACEDGCRG